MFTIAVSESQRLKLRSLALLVISAKLAPHVQRLRQICGNHMSCLGLHAATPQELMCPCCAKFAERAAEKQADAMRTLGAEVSSKVACVSLP